MNPSALPSKTDVSAPTELRPQWQAWAFVVALTVVALSCFHFPVLWGFWQINHYPGFMDAAVITAGAESVRHHIDPMYFNPYDAHHRRLNYPRVWQALSVFLSPDSTPILAFTFWGTFLISLFPILRYSNRVPLLLIIAAVFSPSVILAFERGNCDLLIMALVIGAVYAFEHNRLLSLLLWIAAFMLKLYPLFAGGHLVKNLTRKNIYIAAAVLLLPAVYELQHLQDLLAIRAGTPDTMYGYGGTCFRLVAAEAGIKIGDGGLVVYAIFLALPLLGFFVVPTELRDEDRKDVLSTRLFIASAGIFTGTFILGSNQEYRQIGLIACLPYLFAPQSNYKLKLITTYSWLSLLITFWNPFLVQYMPNDIASPVSTLLFIQVIKYTTYLSLGFLWCHQAKGRIRSVLADAHEFSCIFCV